MLVCDWRREWFGAHPLEGGEEAGVPRERLLPHRAVAGGTGVVRWCRAATRRGFGVAFGRRRRVCVGHGEQEENEGDRVEVNRLRCLTAAGLN